ncbi:hypothetical protein AVEN_270945-1 [Araneus ventricosus]|uniref:Uncharacterized protein n=1 Tax=Araneus ventricosus TaxID=182803 RepID=A0A4Y2R9D0_ARAVE|nr:hypothetical protein AVEN_270945-1 [Araneus ventricosus]
MFDFVVDKTFNLSKLLPSAVKMSIILNLQIKVVADNNMDFVSGCHGFVVTLDFSIEITVSIAFTDRCLESLVLSSQLSSSPDHDSKLCLTQSSPRVPT